MSKTTTVTVDVDVDIDLYDFSDDDLIEELEDRGYNIFHEEDETLTLLDKYDCELILNRLGWDAKPGSEFSNVVEKIRKIYYHGRI